MRGSRRIIVTHVSRMRQMSDATHDSIVLHMQNSISTSFRLPPAFIHSFLPLKKLNGNVKRTRTQSTQFIIVWWRQQVLEYANLVVGVDGHDISSFNGKLEFEFTSNSVHNLESDRMNRMTVDNNFWSIVSAEWILNRSHVDMFVTENQSSRLTASSCTAD